MDYIAHKLKMVDRFVNIESWEKVHLNGILDLIGKQKMHVNTYVNKNCI
jgi:hypothetical protein